MKKRLEDVMWLGSENSYATYESALQRTQGASAEEIASIEAKMFPDGTEKDKENKHPLIDVTDGIAVINIAGSLTNQTGSWLLSYGMTPYTMIYDAVVEAALDDSISSILLSVDSNGGTVAGISHALEGIREAAQIKPIYTHSSSNMNSAAYWIGSAGTHVMADRMAEIGSIGVIAMVAEYTKALKKDGVTAHVFRAGEFKALGGPYEVLTDKAAKTIQDRIDARYDQFIEDVAVNRGYTKDTVKANMAEGRVFLAKDAETVGLIDSIMSFNDAFRFVMGENNKSVSSQLSGSRGIGASASDVELPIQSQIGEEMSKKKVINAKVQAAVAEGADLDASLEALGTEVDESAEGANTADKGALEVKGKVVVEASTETAEEHKVVVPEAKADGMMALVDKVGELSQSLAEANAEVKTLKGKADVAESQVSSLLLIASDSVTRMSIAMGASVQDLSKMSAENLLDLHASTRVEFNKRLPVGQHVDTSVQESAADEAVDALNNRLAGLVAK